MKKDVKKRQLHITLDPEEYEALRKLAFDQRVSMAEIVRRGLEKVDKSILKKT